MVKIFKASKQTQAVGQTVSLTIDRLDNNGLGVAYYQGNKKGGAKAHSTQSMLAKERNKGKPVFIAGVLPKEQISATITEQKSKYLQAKLVEIKTQSPERVMPRCKHVGQCGGCDIQHLSLNSQLAFKQQKIIDLFSRQNLANLPWQAPIKSEPFHYRRKARIGVQYNKKGEPIVGFRRRFSNDLTPIKQCDVLAASIANIFPMLQKVISALSLSQSVGHVEVYATDCTSIVIRQLKRLNAHDANLWLASETQHQWQIFIDDGEKVTPLAQQDAVITDDKPECKVAHAGLEYSLTDDINIEFRATDFIQINHQVNVAMVNQAIDWLELTKQDNVLDLFCGLGNFSLRIAQQSASVTGIEGVAAMTEQATLNAEKNNIVNCRFFHGDLNAHWQSVPWAKSQYNKVLLDPARAGAFEACEQIIALKPSHIVYVSCDPSTLARDSKLFVDAGYQLNKISLIDMFAQTKHVETMVLFERN